MHWKPSAAISAIFKPKALADSSYAKRWSNRVVLAWDLGRRKQIYQEDPCARGVQYTEQDAGGTSQSVFVIEIFYVHASMWRKCQPHRSST